MREHQAFQQGVAGHAVGPVQAGVGGLADGVQAGQVGAGLRVHEHAAAGVVGGGHHRNRLGGDVDAELQAALVDGREVLSTKSAGRWEMSRYRHSLPRRFISWSMARATMSRGASSARSSKRGMKRSAVRQQQARTLAAQGLGDQKGLGPGVVEAGGVELHELHVGDPAAGAPGHGDAVAGGHVRVAGVEVDLAGTAGGEDHAAGDQGHDLSRAPVQHVGADTAVFF